MQTNTHERWMAIKQEGGLEPYLLFGNKQLEQSSQQQYYRGKLIKRESALFCRASYQLFKPLSSSPALVREQPSPGLRAMV